MSRRIIGTASLYINAGICIRLISPGIAFACANRYRVL